MSSHPQRKQGAESMPSAVPSAAQPSTPAAPDVQHNKRVPGLPYFLPKNEPLIGEKYPVEQYDKNKKQVHLFEKFKIRDLELKNRVVVSPMCQYSSDNGHVTPWHHAHIGGFAMRGPGLIIMEASAVSPEGRITPEDNGIWDDSHIDGLKKIVEFVHGLGGKIGIQLAHAGRKSSTLAPWVGHKTASVEAGGWPDNVLAPSAIPFDENLPHPKEMTEQQIQEQLGKWEAAVQRCKTIGFDMIEIHGAHGYLIHNFVSPLSNKRTDQYGGSLENRLRFPLEVTERVKKAWGDRPLWYRVSATDWAEGPEQASNGEWKQWGIEQTKILAKKLQDLGVDLLDVSTGGNWATQQIPVGPGYQVPFAKEIKKALPNLLVGSVGLITDANQAETLLRNGDADVVLLAREFLRNSDWVLKAAQELGVAVKPANEYERAWTRMLQGNSN